jgi:hypothetical protein
MPVVAALAIAVPSGPAVLLALAAVLAFLANGPLVVLLGQRGTRRRDELHGAALRWLAITALGAALAGAAGLVLAPPQVLAVAGLAALPAAVLIGLVWRRHAMHSLAGELVAAVALPGASAPIAVAAGVAWPVALELWLAWSIGYAASVIAVHHVLARRRGPTPLDAARIAVLAILALAAIVLAFTRPAFAIAVPLAVVSTGIAIRAPSPRRLRAIGVGLVVASTVSGALAVAFA